MAHRVRHPTKEKTRCSGKIRCSTNERCSTDDNDCKPSEIRAIQTCSHPSPIRPYFKTPFGLQKYCFSMSDLDWELVSAIDIRCVKMISVLRCGKHTDQIGQLKTTACTLSGGIQIRNYSQCGNGLLME